MQRIAPLSGFPEWLPEQRLVEQEVLVRIARHAQAYGFVPIATRAVEPLSRLVNQGETDKEIYLLRRLHAEDDEPVDEHTLGLHFDLTVPLARYVQEHGGKLDFPFKRYQIQPVWRGERPQGGRYREFIQADLDVVGQGTLAVSYDAEMLLLLADTLAALPFPPVRLLVSNRKILDGFGLALGGAPSTEVIRVLDKRDKIGADAVRRQLIERLGVTPEDADRWLALTAIRSPDDAFMRAVRGLGVTHPRLDQGLEELAMVMTAAQALPPGAVTADLSIARGFDYYTGTVYEGKLVDAEAWGSVCSGGRYDDLASDAGGPGYPGVGVSIGVTRILGRLFAGDQVRASRRTPTCVLVALPSEARRGDCERVARTLRSRGVATEVHPTPARYGKQIRAAERRGVPFVWFPPQEDDPQHSVRDIRSGKQAPADPETWMPPTQDRHVRLLTPPYSDETG